jgi:polygalacturonase
VRPSVRPSRRAHFAKQVVASFVGGLVSLRLLGAAPADPCTPPNFPLPNFGAERFNVREFGATGDGRTNDTPAINKTIDKCNASGGGDVIFPAGTYLAASIHLKSNVRFLLDKNAVITGAKSGYDAPEPNQFEQYQDFGHSHFHNALMWGENIDNFAIVGGRVNGGHIVEGDPGGRDIGDKVISIKSSRNLLFQNITHETGGHFVYLLNACENITVANVTINKSRDGVNLVGCRNVQLHDCHFTDCGDDTIALKSDWALGRKILSENIYVWDSYFESACNALEFGSETTGDFRNVNFWNIGIGRAGKAGIGITTADGGIIDGVNYRDITIKGAACPIFMRITNRLRSGEPGRRTGTIKNVKISNLIVTNCKPGEKGWPRTSVISGQPESQLENVSLENAKIVYRGGGKKLSDVVLDRDERTIQKLGPLPASGFYIRQVKGLTFRDVALVFEAADPRPALIAFDVNGFELNGFETEGTSERVRLQRIDNLTVRSCPGLKNREAENVTSVLKE